MPKIDPAKRRRVMQRSMALGRCVCDPRRPCPCDVFTEQGICPCAGERPDPVPAEEVKLTQRVHNAGCASKIAPGDLERILARLPKVNDPRVLSGIPAGDDAGVYALADGVTLVQTVDVFTPCVDDPAAFGRICAANCLSDIYAMGATPRTALSIVGFPAETLDGTILYQMMKGAMDTLAAAGVALLGGHSIKDEEIKLGFAITGTIAKTAIERGAAGAGDRLVLTKPLGTGVLNFAHQIGRSHAAGMAAAAASMAALNRDAAEAMVAAGASACTDITGFGLFGHLAGMARHSGVTVRIDADALPAFEGALEALADGIIPGAIERNSEYVGQDIAVDDGVDPARVHLGFDAQTSGGLLIAIPAARHAALVEALTARGVLAATIGEVVEASSGRIHVSRGGGARNAPAAPAEEVHAGAACCGGSGSSCCCEPSSESASCCAPPAAEGAGDDALRAFGAFMRATGASGAIDARTKELVNFALTVVQRCGPCVKAHLAKARAMGITQAELDEAAWCAVAMGGAPVRLFYEEMLREA
ncbi:MAG: selenide, water dikinase SelD [Planctomycetes bacterium]|nr:selenide, water dikinase SelD [Planctomycetota bacterium]